MKDKYYNKYLKYKKKYLQLKYGGELFGKLLKSKTLMKGLDLISNIMESVDIESLIPNDTKEEFNKQLITYLNSMNKDNVKLYLEDIDIIKPILEDVGQIFLTNIEQITDDMNNIAKFKDKVLVESDIEAIKDNLIAIQRDIVKLKIKKPINMIVILPQIALKLENLTINVSKLKDSNFIKSVPSFKKIIKKLKIPILKN